MKQKIIETGVVRILLIELPEGFTDLHLYNDVGRPCLYYFSDKESGRLYLPDGNWSILGRVDGVTEEQADQLVDHYEVSHNLDLTATLAFKDYKDGVEESDDYWDEYPFDTALESLDTLYEANEVLFENPVKVHTWASENADLYRKKWEEAQSKVWDKTRTYILIEKK